MRTPTSSSPLTHLGSVPAVDPRGGAGDGGMAKSASVQSLPASLVPHPQNPEADGAPSFPPALGDESLFKDWSGEFEVTLSLLSTRGLTSSLLLLFPSESLFPSLLSPFLPSQSTRKAGNTATTTSRRWDPRADSANTLVVAHGSAEPVWSSDASESLARRARRCRSARRPREAGSERLALEWDLGGGAREVRVVGGARRGREGGRSRLGRVRRIRRA